MRPRAFLPLPPAGTDSERTHREYGTADCRMPPNSGAFSPGRRPRTRILYRGAVLRRIRNIAVPTASRNTGDNRTTEVRDSRASASACRTDARPGTSTIVWIPSVNQDSLTCRAGSRRYPYREGVGEGTERKRSGTSVPTAIRKTWGRRSTRMSETGRACV